MQILNLCGDAAADADAAANADAAADADEAADADAQIIVLVRFTAHVNIDDAQTALCVQALTVADVVGNTGELAITVGYIERR